MFLLTWDSIQFLNCIVSVLYWSDFQFMSIYKKTLKTASIYAICEILKKGTSFFLIPLYTSYFTTADFGVLEMLQLTASIVATLLTMGIHSSVTKFYFERDQEEKRNEVISVTLITMFASGLILTVAVYFTSKYLSAFILDSTLFSKHFFLMFADMSIAMLVQVPETYLMIKQKAVLYSAVSLLRLALHLLIKIVLITTYDMGILGALYGSIIANTITGLFLLGYILRVVRLSFSFDILRKMVLYSVPLLGSWIGQFSMNFGDRFFLTKLSDLSQVGIYSLAYKFGLLGQMMLTGPMMMTWQPRSFEIAHEKGSPKIFAQMFTYFVLIQVYFTLSLSIMVKPMLILMAEPSYHSAYQYVPLISVSYIFQAIFLYIQFGLMNAKKTAVIGISVLIAAGLNLVLNFILIKHLAIWGATLATVVSYGILPMILLRPSQRCYPIPFEGVKLIKITLSATLCYLLSLPIELDSFWLNVAIKLLIILIFPALLFILRVVTTEDILRIKNLFVRR